MIIKIIVLMSLCAVIAFRKHFKKRALFVFAVVAAICVNIFIPAFDFGSLSIVGVRKNRKIASAGSDQESADNF